MHFYQVLSDLSPFSTLEVWLELLDFLYGSITTQ